MPKKEEKERKKLVVEEVETPEEIVEKEPEILKEAASTEVTESPSKEMEKEIHEEEKRLHDIHTEAAKAEQVLSPPPYKKQGSPVLWILIPGIFLLGALLGGIVFYQKGVNKSETQTPTPAPTSEAVQSPTPSPLAKADLTKYPVKIENGSGIAGAAGDAKELLTSAGFKVSGTGNAAAYDYTDTVIQTKSDVPQAFTDQLSKTLSANYTLGKTTELKDTSKDSVIVIIGSSKAR